MKELRAVAVAMKASRIAAERHRTEQEESQRQYRLESERRQLDEQRRKRIEEEIGRWRLARDIREFARETLRVIQEGGCAVTPRGEMDEWLRWCDSYAKRVDPLSSLREEVEKVKAKRVTRSVPPDVPRDPPANAPEPE